MGSSLRRNLVGVLLVVTYVNVLPFLARVPRGMAWVVQYVNLRDGILSENFLVPFAILSAFSTLAAPPLIVAWAIRETHRMTCVVAFALTTFLLVIWHYRVDFRGNDQLLPGLIPIATAVITSGVMFVVGLVEQSLRNKQRRSAPSVSKAARVVKPANPPPDIPVSAGSLFVYGLGLIALVLGLAAWHDRAQTDRLRAEKAIAGIWRGSYTSMQFGEGSAVFQFSTENSPYVHGGWMVEPKNNVPYGQTAAPQEGGQGVSRWASSGNIQGTNDPVSPRKFEMTLALSLSPSNPAHCALKATMTTEISDGDPRKGAVLHMRGPWSTVDCAVAASGQFVLSKPAP